MNSSRSHDPADYFTPVLEALANQPTVGTAGGGSPSSDRNPWQDPVHSLALSVNTVNWHLTERLLWNYPY